MTAQLPLKIIVSAYFDPRNKKLCKSWRTIILCACEYIIQNCCIINNI